MDLLDHVDFTQYRTCSAAYFSMYMFLYPCKEPQRCHQAWCRRRGRCTAVPLGRSPHPLCLINTCVQFGPSDSHQNFVTLVNILKSLLRICIVLRNNVKHHELFVFKRYWRGKKFYLEKMCLENKGEKWSKRDGCSLHDPYEYDLISTNR